jgi:hypothetical protein
MLSVQTFAERYAQVHNTDIDVILDLTTKKDVEAYYSQYANRRIAEHLALYKKRLQTIKRENIFVVECLHVGADSTGTVYTEQELQHAARTISFRPIDFNHVRKFGTGRNLPYPESQTLWMNYNPALQAVTGHVQLDDHHSWLVRIGRIASVSVEFYSLLGIEGRGMVFSGLSLVQDATPADKKARIYGGSWR